MQDVDIVDLRRISELIYERYHYDFRNYAMSSFKRRVIRILELKKLSVACLIRRLTESPPFVNEFVSEVTVNVTEMYRDPHFWHVIRKEVIPAIARQKRKFSIWHAGCSSGEEVAGMCIMLKEMGLLEAVSVTATDLDQTMLERAQRGAFPMKNMALNEKNYRHAGGTAALANYYSAAHGYAVFDPGLIHRVTFRHHDLVLGDVFDTFDLIFCRNVMIYFNQELQNEVLKKFHESLGLGGYLAIGLKESLLWCDYGNRFGAVNNDEKIYRKVKA